MRSLFLAVAVLLASCGSASPRAQSAAFVPSGPKIVATTAATGPTTWTYTETSAFGPSHFALPAGFNPPCPANGLIVWAQQLYRDGSGNAYQWGPTTNFSGLVYAIQNNDPTQPTGFEPLVATGCHANYGDAMTATLTVNYGTITSSTGGTFATNFPWIWDAKADDAGGTLAITDTTTGFSATVPIFYSI